MSLSLLAVPVFLTTTNSSAQLLREWARMYTLGHQVLPSISVATMVLHAYTAYSTRNEKKVSGLWRTFATAGVITVLMLPFTWFIMAPTNTLLFGLEEQSRTGAGDAGFEMVRELVARWRLLHLARSCFPLVGSLVGLSGLWE